MEKYPASNPELIAHTKYDSRRRFSPTTRPLALLDSRTHAS